MKFLFIFLIQFSVCFCFTSYPKEYAETVQTILSLNEARELLADIQSEGPIKIVACRAPHNFGASWNSSLRIIRINTRKNHSSQDLITSILFEMHNAKKDREISRIMGLACRRKISKQLYVQEMEKIEHQNALETTTLLELGQKRGLYPKSILWKMPASFEDYYALQMEAGHTAHHGEVFDLLFRGSMATIPKGGKLSSTEYSLP